MAPSIQHLITRPLTASRAKRQGIETSGPLLKATIPLCSPVLLLTQEATRKSRSEMLNTAGWRGLRPGAHPAPAEPPPQPGTWSRADGSSCDLPLNVELPLIEILIQGMTSQNLTKHFYKKPTFKSPVIFAWQSQWCAHTVLTKELLQLLTCPHPEVTQCPKGTSAAEQRYRRTFLKRQGNHPSLSSLCWAMGKQGNQLGGWPLWDAFLHNQQREREVVHKGKTLPSHQPPALTTLCRNPRPPCWLQISWEICFLI